MLAVLAVQQGNYWRLDFRRRAKGPSAFTVTAAAEVDLGLCALVGPLQQSADGGP